MKKRAIVKKKLSDSGNTKLWKQLLKINRLYEIFLSSFENDVDGKFSNHWTKNQKSLMVGLFTITSMLIQISINTFWVIGNNPKLENDIQEMISGFETKNKNIL